MPMEILQCKALFSQRRLPDLDKKIAFMMTGLVSFFVLKQPTIVQRHEGLQGTKNSSCYRKLNEEESACRTMIALRAHRQNKQASWRDSKKASLLLRNRCLPYRRPSSKGITYGRAPHTWKKRFIQERSKAKYM